jgi:Sugar phosphate isomerases/epimerases
MKISISPEHGIAAGLSVGESLKTVKSAGFDGIDLSFCQYMNEPEKLLTAEWTRNVTEKAALARDAGLEIAQGHLPYYPGHLDNPGDGSAKAFGETWLPMYEHALAAADKTGCKTVVAHPMYTFEGFEKTVENNVYIIDKILPILKQTGIRLAVENTFVRRNRQYMSCSIELAETIAAIADGVNSPYVGACMDTGHANIFRFDICEFARKLAGRLFCLHVNGNAGEDEHAVPLTISGWCERMDFAAFSQTLSEIGYTGWYNLEVSGGRFPACAARPFYEYAACVARSLADLVT